MVAKAVHKDALDILLAALTPENENACRVSLITGLRIGDVLAITTQQVKMRRFTIIEQKTNKKRRVTLPLWLCESILSHAGKVYAFPHRTDALRARTRQAVHKDLKRVANALRLSKGLSAHSMRKSFAVEKYHACGDLKRVQTLLNHSGEAVTALYCLAEQLNFKRGRTAGGPPKAERPPTPPPGWHPPCEENAATTPPPTAVPRRGGTSRKKMSMVGAIPPGGPAPNAGRLADEFKAADDVGGHTDVRLNADLLAILAGDVDEC